MEAHSAAANGDIVATVKTTAVNAARVVCAGRFEQEKWGFFSVYMFRGYEHCFCLTC